MTDFPSGAWFAAGAAPDINRPCGHCGCRRAAHAGYPDSPGACGACQQCAQFREVCAQ